MSGGIIVIGFGELWGGGERQVGIGHVGRVSVKTEGDEGELCVRSDLKTSELSPDEMGAEL